jgi:signal transduction histidine kinase
MPAKARRGRRLSGERWAAWLRIAAVPFAIFQILITDDFPDGYDTAAWASTIVLAVGAVAILVLVYQPLSRRAVRMLGVGELCFDTLVASAFVLSFSFQTGSPVRQLMYLPVLEAAFRFPVWGPVIVVAATTPVLILFEHLRAQHSPPRSFHTHYVTFQVGTELILGLVVGWLVRRLDEEAAQTARRAAEAEDLRDALGRRVDTLEAVNRCARALGSSLELEQAFTAFNRELHGLVPFDRVAILLIEGESMHTIAVAGLGQEDEHRREESTPLTSVFMRDAVEGKTIVRDDMIEPADEAEGELVALGLRSRVAVPLVRGTRPIGLVSVSRTEPSAFSAEEVELLTLLGRLVGTAVQNIRSYETERRNAEELRRLSALRADFVSLVSHELRSPMAAVIGSATTLHQRWRQLTAGQRAAFLALIADETNRLSTLIADVLDTSRIEAGTFSYAFSDVDVGELAVDAAASAELAQDEVPVEVRLESSLPLVRGDRDRLRQVLTNLIDNATKYSPANTAVEVTAGTENGCVRVAVRDHGPGIAIAQQRQIFEKFGRAEVVGGGGKPGTGLGLFIARSIAEAHGGALEVDSTPGAGATFVLTLPLG